MLQLHPSLNIFFVPSFSQTNLHSLLLFSPASSKRKWRHPYSNMSTTDASIHFWKAISLFHSLSPSFMFKPHFHMISHRAHLCSVSHMHAYLLSHLCHRSYMPLSVAPPFARTHSARIRALSSYPLASLISLEQQGTTVYYSMFLLKSRLDTFFFFFKLPQAFHGTAEASQGAFR